MSKKCMVNGCDSPVDALGYCHSHYMRLRRHGHPLGSGRKPGKTLVWLEANVGHQSDECLAWPFSRERTGYGTKVWFGGRGVPPHRVMCVLAHGPSPEGKTHAAHNCGKGHFGCVNPRHIEWKTPKENTADKFIHGTIALGEESHLAKLKDQDVLAIVGPLRHLGCNKLAAKFGVSNTTIKLIRRGETWSWLTGIERRRAGA